MKLENQTLLVISNEPWGDIWYSKHNWAYELSKKNKVFFINPPIKWKISNLWSFKICIDDYNESLQVLGYQKNVLNHLLHYNTLQRISDSELYGNQYTLSSVMKDLNDAILKPDISGNVNSFRQNLQIEYTNNLIAILTGKQSDNYTNNAKSMALYNLNAIRAMAAPTGDVASRAHKQHLRTLIDNALKEVK